MTEADWSDEDALIQAGNWYSVSKQRAEQLAWQRAEEDGVKVCFFFYIFVICLFFLIICCELIFDFTHILYIFPPFFFFYFFQLATMNPCLIFGEMLQPTPVNTSSNAVLSYLNGSRTEIDNCTKCCVAVEDVALAHVLAYERGESEKPEIWGKRFLLVGSCSSWKEMCDVLRGMEYEEGSNVEIPTVVSDVVGPPGLGANPPNVTPYDVSRAENLLGMKFQGVEEMLRGTVMSLEKFGHLK